MKQAASFVWEREARIINTVNLVRYSIRRQLSGWLCEKVSRLGSGGKTYPKYEWHRSMGWATRLSEKRRAG